MSSLWPRIPETVLGRPIPQRFRGFSSRWRDPDRNLTEFIAWLEDAPPPADGDVDVVVKTEPAAAEPSQADGDREALVQAGIALIESSGNEATKTRLLDALVEVGVEPISADGEVFDPDRHVAMFKEPPPEASLENTVASTQRLGFSDRGRVIQKPEVSVYRN